MLAIIDYGSGNIRSVQRALIKAGAKDIIISNDPQIISNANFLLLPGVGAYKQCMEGILAIDGLLQALNENVLQKGAQFLGICVGMQLISQSGIEFGQTNGLGWIEGEVTKLNPQNHDLKIPHMGWDSVTPVANKYFEKAWNNKPQDVYFANSYAFRTKNNQDIAATCQYGADNFVAAVQKDNILGLQFHPEKSQLAGIKMLEAWLKNND